MKNKGFTLIEILSTIVVIGIISVITVPTILGVIKKARMAKNLTQEDLAEKIDISVAFLSRVERGTSHINLKRLTQICNLLDVTEGYILNGASNNSKNYLDEEFYEILKNCTPKKQKLIYSIAKTIAENDSNE